MKKSKHTPGPWRYEAETKTIRAEPTNYWLATMDSWDKAVDSNANAHLIAAAPEMLEALKSIQANNKLMNALNGQDRETLEKIQSAIAKARGES